MELLKPLIALLAIVNPIGALPFFISFTRTFDRSQRKRTIRVSSLSAFIVIAISALAGLRIIDLMIYAERVRYTWELGVLVGYGVVVGVATFIVFSMAERIAKLLGSTGINVMTRLMGLLLAAVAVEIMTDGLTKLFPILGSRPTG